MNSASLRADTWRVSGRDIWHAAVVDSISVSVFDRVVVVVVVVKSE